MEAPYYGALCPSEKPPAGSDAEKDQAAYYASALHSGEDKTLFEAFAESNQAFCERSCCEYFCDGFRLGARIMLEVLRGGATQTLPPDGRRSPCSAPVSCRQSIIPPACRAYAAQ